MAPTPEPEAGNADLVSRLRLRQPQAFAALYGRYREPVWRLLIRLARQRALAEDLFQETWLSAARHVHALAEDTRLLPWLCTIARNKHRNALRLALFDDLRQSALLRETDHGPPSPEQMTAVRAEARAVVRAFARLPDAYREILELTAVEGLDSAAVGEILGLRPDAARKRLSRARAELVLLMERGR